MTAVEWYAEEFAEHLEETYGVKITSLSLLKKAKEMEKEQIEKAYIYGAAYGIDISNNLSPDIYYNETFKSE